MLMLCSNFLNLKTLMIIEKTEAGEFTVSVRDRWW